MTHHKILYAIINSIYRRTTKLEDAINRYDSLDMTRFDPTRSPLSDIIASMDSRPGILGSEGWLLIMPPGLNLYVTSCTLTTTPPPSPGIYRNSVHLACGTSGVRIMALSYQRQTNVLVVYSSVLVTSDDEVMLILMNWCFMVLFTC